VFHCAAGKDRTGVVAALLLAALGVDDDTIAHDYALSTYATEQMIAWLRVERPEALAEMESVPTAFLASPSGAMQRFLDLVRERHGSPEGYLVDIGLDAAAIGSLRANLLD
jgi:protein tyrosine/serine phosphatase